MHAFLFKYKYNVKHVSTQISALFYIINLKMSE